MIVDILLLFLILFIGIFGARKGFLDEVSEFIGIGLAIWFALSFYTDLTITLSEFLFFLLICFLIKDSKWSISSLFSILWSGFPSK